MVVEFGGDVSGSHGIGGERKEEKVEVELGIFWELGFFEIGDFVIQHTTRDGLRLGFQGNMCRI